MAYTRSRPPRRVSKPIACPNKEKSLTYIAQEAVYEFVKSPVLAISTAANESPEKNPGKRRTQQAKRKSEFRISEYLKSALVTLAIIWHAYG
jgi:hypothetical protein